MVKLVNIEGPFVINVWEGSIEEANGDTIRVLDDSSPVDSTDWDFNNNNDDPYFIHAENTFSGDSDSIRTTVFTKWFMNSLQTETETVVENLKEL